MISKKEFERICMEHSDDKEKAVVIGCVDERHVPRVGASGPVFNIEMVIASLIGNMSVQTGIPVNEILNFIEIVINKTEKGEER